jgi:hypothetical protein
MVAPVRDLFSEHPLAVRCSPEQITALLWVLSRRRWRSSI